MESFFMGGALLGNVLIAARFGRKAEEFLFGAMVISGALMVVFIWLISPLAEVGRNGAFFTLSAVATAVGVSEAFIETPIESKLQRAVPSDVRSRVFSAMGILTRISTPLGLVLVGPLLNLYPAWLVALDLWLGMVVVVMHYWLRHREILLMDVQAKEERKESLI